MAPHQLGPGKVLSVSGFVDRNQGFFMDRNQGFFMGRNQGFFMDRNQGFFKDFSKPACSFVTDSFKVLLKTL